MRKGVLVDQDVRQSLGVKAADKKAGMTLDEVARFVQAAMRQGMPGSAKVSCLVGFRAQVQELQVESQ